MFFLISIGDLVRNLNGQKKTKRSRGQRNPTSPTTQILKFHESKNPETFPLQDFLQYLIVIVYCCCIANYRLTPTSL